MSATTAARARSPVLLTGLLLLALLAGCGRAAPQSRAASSPPGGSPPGVSSADASSPDVSSADASSAGGLTPDQATTLASLQKVDDYPLYTMRYYGSLPPTASALRPSASQVTAPDARWACSLYAALGDADGRLFGRNFDWRFSPGLLLFTEPPDGYASVSMVDLEYFGVSDRITGRLLVDPLQLSLGDRRALLDAPAMPFDGMNSAGVAVGMAALPEADTRHDPGKASIGSIAVIREILDHAGTVDEGVAILKRWNIDFEGGPPLHYLVADRSGAAALVEFHGGQIVVLPAKGGWLAATNFVLSAAWGDGTGQCPRYDVLVRKLTATSGILSGGAARALLQSVSQPIGSKTQWSVVYNLSQGQVEVVMGRRYDRVRTFRLAGSGTP
jgi:hypothetical protein